MKPISLEGKVALVTGGAGGIGRSVAESFAELGARVLVADSNPEAVNRSNEEARGQGLSIDAVECDVRDTTAVRALIQRAEAKEGRLDILVNNVGHTLRLFKPLEEMTDENIDDLFSVLLRHVMICSREAIPLIKRSGEGGSIISVSTIEAFRGIPGNVVYSAFNAGITGFTRSLALELGPAGIRVNAITPGFFLTEQNRALLTNPDGSPTARGQKIVSQTPMGRLGEPDELNGALLWLVSDDASFVTGSVVDVDGGFSAYSGV